jgi:hypothetical protein
MSSSKKINLGFLRQVFIIVYRLEIQSVMLVFLNQFCELLHQSPPLWFNYPPSPLPCVNTYTVCKGGGGYGVLSLRQINTCRKVPYR